MSKPRLIEIQQLTGFAICLVVCGHLASRSAIDIPIYVAIKKLLYKFHMPLFMCLSGFVSFYSYKSINNLKEYFRYIEKKAYRIFPAYIILSFIFIFGNYVANSTLDLKSSLINMVFYPSLGDSGYLWYIYVLFLFYFILPILIKYSDKLLLLLPFFFGLSFIKFPFFLSLHAFFWYLPFFTLGGIIYHRYNYFKQLLNKFGPLFCVIFFVLIILEFFYISDVPKQIIGLISIFCFFYLSLNIVKRSNLFNQLGGYSFYIYLFNTVFIGALNLVLIKYLGKQQYYYYFYYLAPFLVLSGIYFPILLQKHIISKVPFLKNWIK